MLLSQSQVINLYRVRKNPCVSIYLPTHRSGNEIQQDPIRLKNALASAHHRLTPYIERPADRSAFLAQAEKLVDDERFWHYQDEGLAIFIAEDIFQLYRCPRAFEPFSYVGARFHLEPLVPLIGGTGRYHVLALSQNAVRLLEGSRESMRELDLHDIPESLAEAVGYDWQQRSLQFHSGARHGGQGGGSQDAMYHGHGESQDKDGEIETFLHRVDAGLCQLLAGQDTPLVVASVERLHAAFAKLTKLPRVLGDFLRGNPDHLSAHELHQRSWPIVEPLWRETRARVAEELTGNLARHNPRASSDPTTVIRAATRGQIATLFLREGAHQWGVFDADSDDLELVSTPSDGDEDLLDLAAMETMAHGGTVYVVNSDEMPTSQPIAAWLRYAEEPNM